jgi:hypothetical protein
MRVLTLRDGSCPSCGATGEVVERVWRGRPVSVLIPPPMSVAPRYACLCLRPFAVKFRAAARLRAVGHAMHPFGTTVALLDQTDHPFHWSKVPTITFGMTSLIDLFFAALYGLWKLLRRRGVTLVGKVDDERWHSTFRGLALHSRLIVMDVSRSGTGLAYEADYISDLGLSDRLILVHEEGSTPDDTLGHFREKGITPPVVSYESWRLGQFAQELRHTARVMLDAKG